MIFLGLCAAYDSKLATLEEMISAYKKGANWCSYGWSEGQIALYPTQSDFWNKLQEYPYRKNECGDVGVNGGFFENKHYKFGVNCYGKGPNPKSGEVEKYSLGEKKLSKTDLMAEKYKHMKDEITVAPFSQDRWHS